MQYTSTRALALSWVAATSEAAERAIHWLRRAYWSPFYRLTGAAPDQEERAQIPGWRRDDLN